MQKSVFWTLYTSLTHTEARKLLEFVNSPFFNTQPELSAALEYFNECRFYLKVSPSKENTYKKLYGRGPYQDQKIRTLLSKLKRLTEQFLVVQNLLREDNEFQLKLARSLRERGLHKHFQKEISTHSKKLQKAELRDARYLRQRFLNRQENYQFYSVRRETQQIDMALLIEELDQAYYAELLRLACSQISYKAFMDDPKRDQQMQVALNFIQEKNWIQQPAIGAYYHTFLALSRPKESEHFLALKDLLFNQADAFSPEELRNLFLLSINYCIKRYNEGNKSYLKEEFLLFKEGFRRNLFMQEGYLSPFSFRNSVTLALVLKEYDWVDQFIGQYAPLLPPEQRENLRTFSLARLAFERQEFEKAMDFLRQTDYSDLLLSLAAKSIQIKVYYSLGEEDLLDYHLKAMRAYIRRKKVMGYHREHYLNLVNFTQKMLDTPTFEKEKRGQLIQQVKETRRVAEKAWLLKTLESR